MTVTMVPTTTSPGEKTVVPTSGRFRPDIDGLRALAILLVVGYHAEVPGMAAGFIGVDVFFVISGFLITTVLVNEMDSSGTVRLGRFWARRARRLLPAASLVTVFCLLAGMAVLSPLEWNRLANEGLAATTYWSNVLFGLRAADYFESGAQTSPLLHTWSLSVEEQFYLVWPILLLGILRLSRVAGAQVGRIRVMGIGLVTAASFALSLRLTAGESSWAFFSSLSRGWELGAGALLAVIVPTIGGRWPRWRASARLVGLGVLMTALVVFDGRTPFPGWAAALPVLGTLALISGGPGGDAVSRLLGARPLQTLGRMSYSWYLWHWPILVLGVTYLGVDHLAGQVTLVAVSLVPAALTHWLVENPIRHSVALNASLARTLGVVTLIVGATLGVGLFSWARAAEALRDPRLHALAVARADRPPLAAACATTDVATLEERCMTGDPQGRTTILVIGDSHAAQWLPAIDGAARTLGARVINSVQGNCPSLGVAWSSELPSCGLRRSRLPALVEEIRPQLVLVSHSVGYIGSLVGPSVAADQPLGAWTDSLGQLATQLRNAGTGLAVILDTPRLVEDPIACLSHHREPGRCDMTLADVRRTVASFHRAERDALQRAGHGSALDPLTFLCDDGVCPSTKDGRAIYADTHHLTASFSATLADQVRLFLGQALATSPDIPAPGAD